jgi:espin
MRSTFTPPSPSDSSESFFLHDPQEVIYNRVKDIFESDTSTSVRDEPRNNRSNAMIVQAEIHSSSSGATSSDDDINDNMKAYSTESKVPPQTANSNHDYEDIYLVREEAKSSAKKLYGRSRSRDSGSHSRDSSTTRNHEVIVHSRNIHFDTSRNYEIPRKNQDKKNQNPPQNNQESTYESVGPADNHLYERKNNNNATSNANKNGPIEAPPLPPPLPPPLMKNHNVTRNANRDSTDSLADSIDFDQMDDNSLESDSGLEVVEEPTVSS